MVITHFKFVNNQTGATVYMGIDIDTLSPDDKDDLIAYCENNGLEVMHMFHTTPEPNKDTIINKLKGIVL